MHLTKWYKEVYYFATLYGIFNRSKAECCIQKWLMVTSLRKWVVVNLILSSKWSVQRLLFFLLATYRPWQQREVLLCFCSPFRFCYIQRKYIRAGCCLHRIFFFGIVLRFLPKIKFAGMWKVRHIIIRGKHILGCNLDILKELLKCN